MNQEEAGSILDKWLSNAKRCLTPQQRHIVLNSFSNCPLPLFLKLIFDEACRWKSFTPDQEAHLPSTIPEIINSLFDRLEKLHGNMLVRRSLAYISASRNGLTESELEDLLSLDDDVLNDVYQYWTPPVRRLPPLLWLRVRADLGDYLVERGSEGARVNFWYHRQFIEVCRERYLQGHQHSVIHCNMAEYFLGKWSNGEKKPFVNKNGEHFEMDRLVAQQPLMYSTNEEWPVFNKRKLAELPYHLLKTKQVKKLKEAALFNYDFLLAKFRSMSHGLVMEDMRMAMNVFPEDEELHLMYDVLDLCTNALKVEPRQLASQLIGRLFKLQQDSSLSETYPFIAKLFMQLQSSSVPYFLPNSKCLTSSGGPLLHAIAEHEESWIDSISIAHDNSSLLTTVRGNEGLEIRIFNLRSGIMERKLILSEPIPDIYYVWHTILSRRDKEKLVMVGGRNLLVLDLKNGQVVQTMEALSDDLMFNQTGYEAPPIALGDSDQRLAALTDKGVKIWSMETGQLEHELPVQGLDTSGCMGTLDASDEYVVFCKRGSTDIVVINITTGKVVLTINPAIERSNGSHVKFVRITNQKKVIVMSSSLSDLNVFDLASAKLEKEVKGFSANATVKELIITDDGQKLVCQDKYELAIWDLRTWKCRKVLHDIAHVHSPNVKTNDGRIVVHANIADYIIRVYDASKDESKETSAVPATNEWAINQINALYPGIDGRHFITSSTVNMTNEVSVWDAKQGKQVRVFKNTMFYASVLRMVSSTVGIGYIYNEKTNHYVLLDFDKGTVVRRLEGKACKRMYMMELLDNNRMVSFSRGRRNLKIWDIQSGKVVEQIKFGQKYRFEAFLLSGNKKTIVIAQAGTYSDIKDETVPFIVYNFASGKHHEIREDGKQLKLETIGLSLNACISHSGRYVVTVNEYTTATLWDVLGRRAKHPLIADPPGPIYSTCISHNENIALTSYTGSSHGVHVWDIDSGKCVRNIRCATAINEIRLTIDEQLVFWKDLQGSSFYVHEFDTGRNLATFTLDQPIAPQAFNIIDDRVVTAATGSTDVIIFCLRRPNGAHSGFEKASTSVFENDSDIVNEFDYNPTTLTSDPLDDDDDDKDDDDDGAAR